MNEKQNPWLDEGTRYDEANRKPKQDIRSLKFQDNATHTVRILPSKKTGEFPFFGYKQHWIPQNGSTIGKPITHGIDDRCACCEYISKIWEEIHRLKEEHDMTDKSPEVVALLEKTSKVGGKVRYDMNVIHREDCTRKDEETGEQVVYSKRMDVGGTVYKEIFGYAKKWGSPSNEETGYDIEIVTTGVKEKREYRLMPDRDASPLTAQEKKLIEKVYDLKSLRQFTSSSEIKKILENARSPFNEEISVYLSNDDSAVKQSQQDVVKETEKEIKKVIEEKSKEPVVEKVVEVAKEEKKEVVIEENTPKDDEHNLEVYECKGDFDENDKMCIDCPVKSDCEQVHPSYVKARQMKINVDPHRPTKEVVDEVKKNEESQPATSKRKKIPF